MAKLQAPLLRAERKTTLEPISDWQLPKEIACRGLLPCLNPGKVLLSDLEDRPLNQLCAVIVNFPSSESPCSKRLSLRESPIQAMSLSHKEWKLEHKCLESMIETDSILRRCFTREVLMR
jgi:hypothetical protein